jgi:uncharacterized protein DUF5946
MSSSQCAECGAVYTTNGDSCAARFNALLALDHSRREPWGSRHGQAFAAFALQHRTTYAASLDRAWAALHRIYVDGEAAERVFDRLVTQRGGMPPEWSTPPRPSRQVAAPSITIADLADFEPDTYPEHLDAWCRASLAAWGARLPPARS